MATIDILMVGWNEDELTLGAVGILESGRKLMLRTEKCGAAEYLKKKNISFQTFDSLFEECDDFDELNDRIIEQLINTGDVVYCINDPFDACVPLLLANHEIEVHICPFCGAWNTLMLMAGGNAMQLDASDYETMSCEPSRSMIICEIDNRLLASEVKVRLIDYYGAEHPVTLCSGNKIKTVPLYELDRLDHYDHQLCMLVPAVEDLKKHEKYTFSDILRIMDALLSPDGCPWDKEQTHESLRTTMIEEAYEAVDAINNDDTDSLYDELGDVLFQVVFHSAIGKRHGEFDINDVTDAIGHKLIERHPHVFSNEYCDNSEETKQLWERMKAKKRGYTNPAEALKNITYGLPALLKCAKMLNKTNVLNLKKPDLKFGDTDEDSIGKKLYEIVAKAAELSIDPESALQKVINQYITKAMEENT